MSLWNRGAPVEQPARDVEGGQRCQACKVTDQPANPITMRQIPLPGYGHEWVCSEQTPCLDRAELSGAYLGKPRRRA